jgi:hypothetical protein
LMLVENLINWMCSFGAEYRNENFQ